MELDFLSATGLPVISLELAIARRLGEIAMLSLTCGLSNAVSKTASSQP